MSKTNVRRIRPTEVAAVADLLSEAGEDSDIEELAKEICRTINRLRATEAIWVRIVKDGTGYLFYGTYRSAEEAHADDLSSGTRPGCEVRVVALGPPYGQAMEQAT